MFEGWNSQAHREFPGKFESRNLSRDNLSREIGRTSCHDMFRGLGVPAPWLTRAVGTSFPWRGHREQPILCGTDGNRAQVTSPQEDVDCFICLYVYLSDFVFLMFL